MGVQWIYNKFYPYFRGKRLDLFAQSFALRNGGQWSVLDVGGCPTYWQYRSLPLEITCLNLPEYHPPADLRGCRLVRGDGTAIPSRKESFDIAHSNSVIEHLGTWDKQQAFAREVRRVGKGVWIQTPARSFPIECHTLDPFFHFLPKRHRRRFLRNGTLLGLLTRPTEEQIEKFLSSTRLLDKAEMHQLFPDCSILVERFGGLDKSYIAFRPVTAPRGGLPRAVSLEGRA